MILGELAFEDLAYILTLKNRFIMKRRKLLKYIILIKRIIRNLFKEKQNNILLDNEKAIMEFLFKDINTENSINLYNKVSKRFFKELKSREIKAKSEVEIISVFMNDNSYCENGKLIPLVFQKVLEEQTI